MKNLLTVLAALLLAAPAVRADDEKPAEAAPAEEKPAEAAPAEEKPAEAAPAEEKAAPAEEKAAPAEKPAKAEGKAKHGGGGGGDHAYVDTAVKFLSGLAHSARKGEKGQQGWAEVAESAADKVSIKIGGDEHTVDVGAKKSDVRLMKYQKLSTWRDGKDIKGVTAEVLEFKVGKEMKSGKGKVAMEEKDGAWKVTGITVE
jgi:hypothetical protein